ncbi:MAG: transporter [Burkholderiales bacterium]
MKKTHRIGQAAALVTIAAALGSTALQAQEVPARFYLKSLAGGNGVPLIYKSMSGNTNPFDPAHIVTPGANFDATMTMVGFAKTLPLFDRAAVAAVVLPMGRISGNVNVAGTTINQSANGFGDPMLELNVNLIGPAVQKSIPDAIRYEPGISVDVLADLAIPIGEYNHDKALNLGQNRWYGRIGFPINWQLGAWVPGQRTTLEFLPAAWIFGQNTDFVGQTMKTDPLYRFDAHLTRDFTENLWGSLDASLYKGGQASINGVQGEKRDDRAVGLTLGYVINDNLNMTFGYMSTIGDSKAGAMNMDSLMISFVYGWHPIIEGGKRLKGDK